MKNMNPIAINITTGKNIPDCPPGPGAPPPAGGAIAKINSLIIIFCFLSL
jgi:hypothetical protein